MVLTGIASAAGGVTPSMLLIETTCESSSTALAEELGVKMVSVKIATSNVQIRSLIKDTMDNLFRNTLHWLRNGFLHAHGK